MLPPPIDTLRTMYAFSFIYNTFGKLNTSEKNVQIEYDQEKIFIFKLDKNSKALGIYLSYILASDLNINKKNNDS